MPGLYPLRFGSPTRKRRRIASKYLDYNKIYRNLKSRFRAEAMAGTPISTAHLQ
jgi:hypothetical protein